MFNKSNNGSEEIKAVLGFTHASMKFSNLENFMSFAKKDVVKVIGKEVFKLADDFYRTDEFGKPEYPDQNNLVNLIQTVMAYSAYRRYVKSNDLSHSETGRQITVQDEIKPAFEWMVDKDDANLLSLANETFELLLDFLDELIAIDPPGTIANAWMESEAFKSMNSCIVNRVQEFEKVFYINGSRRIYIMLLPFLRKAERSYIPGAITEGRYDALVESIKDGELDPEQEIIRELATQVIVNHALAKALKMLPAESIPEVFGDRFLSEKLDFVDTDARLGAAQVFEQEAKSDYTRLQRYIRTQETVIVVEIDDETEDETDLPFYIC